jgi:galactokinase
MPVTVTCGDTPVVGNFAPGMTNTTVPADLLEKFHSAYGAGPEVIASAPGRVNLIGDHLDYNGGEVLPIAIDQRTWLAVSRSNGAQMSRAVSLQDSERGEFDISHPRRDGKWWDYVSGLGADGLLRTGQVNIAVSSEVPSGAGLSSSAALEVSAAVALAELGASDASLRDLALDAWKVETKFVGVSCGIMDQFASALAKKGNALHIWCETQETEDVPFSASVLIFDTGVPRSLRNSAFNDRQAECAEALSLLRRSIPDLPNLASVSPDQVLDSDLPGTLRLRALHVAEEMCRVKLAVEQLKTRGAVDADLLYQSHVSLRDQYQCSSPELDWFVDRAMMTDGVQGARLTGAGWGGCAIALGERDALEEARESLAREYEKIFHVVPRTWLSRAATGARVYTNESH